MRGPGLPWRAARALLALGGPALALAGCGAHPPAARAPHTTADPRPAFVAPRLITPAHLVAVPDSSSISYTATDGDGTVRLIAHGMRLLEHPDGSIDRARQLLPAVRSVRTLKLPGRLGHGFVFYVRSSDTTLVWRSSTWTGALKPLANVDFGVSRIVAGFDRLYLVDRLSRNVVAIDADTGKVTGSSVLPPSPSYGSMAIADAWMGAVEVPYRGVLATFDAGASWHPVTSQRSYGVLLQHGRIEIRLASGTLVVDPSGTLRRQERGSDDATVFRGAARDPSYVSWVDPDQDETAKPPASPPPGPLGRRLLDLAVLRGFPDSAHTAVVAAGGAVGRVRLSDGKLLDVKKHAFPRGSTCAGIELGRSFGFVCGQEHGSTVVYAFEPPLSLDPVLSFDEPRYVASSGNGALVIRGGCSGHASDNPGEYCIRARDGTLRKVRVRGDPGVERVVALSDGRVAVIVPPRLGAPGLLVLIDVAGHSKSVKMRLPDKAGKPILALLEKGLWLDGFVERGEDELAGWVAAGGPFVGVRLHLDGKLEAGMLESDTDRSLFSGPLALSQGDSGLAVESIDGGFKWREIALPVEGDGSSFSSAVPADERTRGCSRVGCALGSWLRVGWRGSSDEKAPINAVQPPRETVLPPSGGGRWLLTCSATGERTGERLTPHRAGRAPRPRSHPMRYGALPGPDQLQSTGWAPFFGKPPPAKRADEIGFDAGTEHGTVKVHGYVWGARGASWDRVGHFLLRVVDRFSVDRAIWSTAPTPSPWDDMSQAALVFGLGSYSSSVNWVPMLDPSGRAGALMIRSRGIADLYLFDEGRSTTKVSGERLTNLEGVVKLGTTWYVGTGYGASEFRVFRIEGSRLSLLGRYPVRVGSRSGNVITRLVRSARGDALGIWARARKLRGSSTSWFVFPIDLATRRAGPPLVIDPAALASAPPCGEDDDGWLLEGEPPVPPYMDFVGDADPLRVHRIAARMIASARGMCIDSLAAEADSPVPVRLRPAPGGVAAWSAGRQTVPLVVTGRGGGVRWGFRCMR